MKGFSPSFRSDLIPTGHDCSLTPDRATINDQQSLQCQPSRAVPYRASLG
jgi:hypothetical protein